MWRILFPTRHHLPLAWMTGLRSVSVAKTGNEAQARRRTLWSSGWILAFGHDPDFPAATLHERNGKVEFEPVDLSK